RATRWPAFSRHLGIRKATSSSSSMRNSSSLSAMMEGPSLSRLHRSSARGQFQKEPAARAIGQHFQADGPSPPLGKKPGQEQGQSHGGAFRRLRVRLERLVRAGGDRPVVAKRQKGGALDA